MKSLQLAILIFLFSSSQVIGQNETPNKSGFFFGFALGASSLDLTLVDQASEKSTGMSLPNFKIGKMVSDKMALMVYLPGSLYEYKQSGRARARGFEAILPSAQFWVKDRFWLMGGVGLGLDAPAFFDIKDEEERTFSFGYAGAVGAGYELVQKRNKTIDLQTRIHYGSIDTDDGNLKGFAVSFLVGFNLY